MPNEHLDQPTNIRKGEELDTTRLLAYLKEQLPEIDGPLSIKQFPGGFSNLTYSLKYGDQDFVLRRPPFGANIKSAHDMSREYRIFEKLIKHYQKVPKPILYCEDEQVLGAPFYIMERVQGVILRSTMPKYMHPSPDIMRGIAEALVDTFVELHEVDYHAAGLGALGKPEGYVERQITGWTKRYFKAKTDEVPSLENAAKWLAENQPSESSSALIHNDFKYDNMILDADNLTQVKAVLDWEMATLGDPLLDLGTSIAYWFDADDPDALKAMGLSPTLLPGNPGRAEIVQWYSEKSGKDVGNIVFYYVFGLFKIAVIVQQIYARFKKGYTQDPRFAHLNMVVEGFGILAEQAIQKKRIDKLFS